MRMLQMLVCNKQQQQQYCIVSYSFTPSIRSRWSSSSSSMSRRKRLRAKIPAKKQGRFLVAPHHVTIPSTVLYLNPMANARSAVTNTESVSVHMDTIEEISNIVWYSTIL